MLRAQHIADNETRQWVLCNAPADVFSVKVIANSKYNGLYIGFCSPKRSAWWLAEVSQRMVENLHSKESALWKGQVEVWNNGHQFTGLSTTLQKVQWLQSKNYLREDFELPWGQPEDSQNVQMGLTDEEVQGFVGCVEFYWKGDKVEMISWWIWVAFECSFKFLWINK